MAAAVEAGELARAVAGCRAGSEAPTGPLRVARLEKGKADRWTGTLADGGGGATMECLLATQLGPLAESGEVGPGAFVRLTKFSLTEVGGKQMLIVTGLEVEEAASAVKVEAVAAAPAVKVEAAAAAPAVPAAKAAPPSGSPPAASEGSLSVAEAYTAPDGEAPMDRASLIHALKNCADLAWDAGPHYAEALARKTASFVKNVLQQGNLTQGNPWAGDPEVADPVRGSGSSVKRKKRPEPGRPAGKSGKKGRVARLEKVECKV